MVVDTDVGSLLVSLAAIRTRSHASEPVAMPSNKAVRYLRDRPGCSNSVDPNEWCKPSRTAQSRQSCDPGPPSKEFAFDENQHLAGSDAIIERFEPKPTGSVES